MADKRRKREKGERGAALPVLRPHAAGIDIGAREIYVAVPPEREAENVRCFPTFTQDLYALAEWLQQCGVTTVAMESTGVYWIPLFQILEARGLEVCLVNARPVKNVSGRRTDVSDCQWLQFLHSVGLLRASYRPEQRFAPFARCGGIGRTWVPATDPWPGRPGGPPAEEVIAKALVGDYRPEHWSALRQSWAAYQSYQQADRGV